MTAEERDIYKRICEAFKARAFPDGWGPDRDHPRILAPGTDRGAVFVSDRSVVIHWPGKASTGPTSVIVFAGREQRFVGRGWLEALLYATRLAAYYHDDILRSAEIGPDGFMSPRTTPLQCISLIHLVARYDGVLG